MTTELRIKAKHLGEEAKIIRFEERKLKKNLQYVKQKHAESGANEEFNDYTSPLSRKIRSITQHRRWYVRNECRATQLARAFIEGKTYSSIEQKCDVYKRDFYILPRIVSMVDRYGNIPIEKEYFLNGTAYTKRDQYLRLLIKEWFNKD